MIKALQFLSDKNQSFRNNYLLVGDNDFLYLFIKNQIVKKLKKKDETFVFDCADKSDSLDQLMNVLGSQDLFSSNKLIIIKNINKLNKKNSELLLNSFDSDSSDQIIFIDNNFLSYDYKSKSNTIKSSVTKEYAKVMDVVDISTPFESEMKHWIHLFAHELNLKVSDKYTQKIIEIFGNNFSEIFNEMSKSSLVSSDEKDLLNALEKSANIHKEKQLWELNYAICDRRVDAIFENGLSIMKQYGLSYVINSMFTLLEAIFITKKNNGTLIESSSRSIRGNLLKRISPATNNYSLDELEHAINIFAQTDIKLKTQKIIDETEFTNIINGAFRHE
jgi:DNA polymerase III delta subunit